MKTYGWFKDELEKAKKSFEYRLDEIESDFTEKILEILEGRNLSRADLAKKLGVSRSAVSNLLNNGSNITMRRMLEIAEALNCKLHVALVESSTGFQEKIDYRAQPENLIDLSKYFKQRNASGASCETGEYANAGNEY